MSLKTAIQSRIAVCLTREARLQNERARVERARRRNGQPHVVDYFHQADDPYSHLAVQGMRLLAQRYDVEFRPYLIGPAPDWAAPERERLSTYARLDAARLAQRAGFRFVDPGAQPPPEHVAPVEAALASALSSGAFLEEAVDLGERLWSGSPVSPRGSAAEAEVAKAEGARRRAALGHYLGAMIHYGGEWYWGLDRLHYLEARLAELGARKAGAPDAPIYLEGLPARAGERGGGARPVLEAFLSFRSPYTWIALARARAVADACGAELLLRPVLPMVMRGLPVPPQKRMYILMDAAREARRLGVSFGRIADPVGRPVERGYSLFPWARSQGRGYEYCNAFMEAVWSQGVDAGSDAGLRRIVEAAGLSWSEARLIVGNNDWRPEMEANRKAMFELGLWGVPSFRAGDVVTWGQDRLWVMEEALRK